MFSTFQPHPQDPSEIRTRRWGGYRQSTNVDNSALVHKTASTTGRLATLAATQMRFAETSHERAFESNGEEVEVHGLQIIGKALQNRGILTVTADIIESAWQSGTKKPCIIYAKRWIQFCAQRQRDPFHHRQHHQSLNCEGRWGTADDFATSFLHFTCSPLPSGTCRTPGLSVP